MSGHIMISLWNTEESLSKKRMIRRMRHADNLGDASGTATVS